MFFERIIEWDWPDAPPRNPILARRHPTTPEPLPKFLDDRDAARLMAAARASTDPRDRLVVEMLARTGLRAGELCDLDADAVVQIGDGHWLRVPVGKLRNDRYVPLHPDLVELLADWTAANLEHIRRHRRLVADHRGPLDRAPSSAASSRRVGRAAGVPSVHPHQLRHTLATQAINRGMRLEAIAALLGHRIDGDDPHLRPHRRPGRRRRIRRRQRQDRRPLQHRRPDAARRDRDRRHDPAAPRSPRPHARQRPLHPPRRTRLPHGIRLRDLRLLPDRHPSSCPSSSANATTPATTTNPTAPPSSTASSSAPRLTTERS